MSDSSPPDPGLLNALRAALATGPMPLLGKASKPPTPGLFPNTAPGKKIAAEAVRLGLVEEFTEQQTVTTTTKGGKSKTTRKDVTLAHLTPEGRQYYLTAVTPKAALEALLPAVQKLGTPPPPPDPGAFRAVVADAAAACVTAIREAFDGLQQKVVAALPRAGSATDPGPVLVALRAALDRVSVPEQVATSPPPPPASVSPPPPPPPAAPVGPDPNALGDEIVTLVEQSAGEQSVGCDFGELFDALEPRHSGLTIGTFHDTLRALDRANRIQLGGWSRMLDDMKRPELALFVTHKVMYYAHPAR